MLRAKAMLVVATVTLASVLMVGCPAAPLTIPVPIPLGTSLGEFEVQAGESSQLSGTTSFTPPQGISIASATLELDSDAVTITPTESAKGLQAQVGDSNTAEVTVWIAPFDEVGTVCGGGEQYGPFTITFNDDYVIQSIEPSRVTLSQNTVDLLNAGQFSLCIRVLLPVDGTIRIGSLQLNVSPQLGG